MSDILDEIISQLAENVNKKSEWLENSLQKTNWKLINADATRGVNTNMPEDQSLAAINKAYESLVKGAELNKLTDSFCTEKSTKTESKTERSLKETISRFTRQHSIIQAHC